jgi:hypothetical protein
LSNSRPLALIQISAEGNKLYVMSTKAPNFTHRVRLLRA